MDTTTSNNMSLKKTNKTSPKTTSRKSTKIPAVISSDSSKKNSTRSMSMVMMQKNTSPPSKIKSKNDNLAPSKKPNKFTKKQQMKSLVFTKPSVASKTKRALSTAGMKSKKRKSWETFERSMRKFTTPSTPPLQNSFTLTVFQKLTDWRHSSGATSTLRRRLRWTTSNWRRKWTRSWTFRIMSTDSTVLCRPRTFRTSWMMVKKEPQELVSRVASA